MVLYLNHVLYKYHRLEPEGGNTVLMRAIHEGAVLRVRPKVMTVATIMAGLLPIMWGSGSGSEVMQRIGRADDWWHGNGTVIVDVSYSRTLQIVTSTLNMSTACAY